MYIYIVFSSFISSLLVGLFGRYFGRESSIVICILTLIISFIFSILILQEILFSNNIIIVNLYNLFIITAKTILLK